MKRFSKEVDMRSRRSMTEFLVKHFRYNTMNSWNQSTSYANNIKIYNLGLNKEQEEKLYAMLDTTDFYTYINEMLSDFSAEHNHLWQVGFNGRSSGYLVLYQGYSKPSGYKSFCTECGQRNFKTVEETGNKDIAKLSDILGHTSINTTRVYIISTGAEHRRQMENMRLII